MGVWLEQGEQGAAWTGGQGSGAPDDVGPGLEGRAGVQAAVPVLLL